MAVGSAQMVALMAGRRKVERRDEKKKQSVNIWRQPLHGLLPAVGHTTNRRS